MKERAKRRRQNKRTAGRVISLADLSLRQQRVLGVLYMAWELAKIRRNITA